MDCVCQCYHKECSTRTCADDWYNCWKKSKLKSYVRPWSHGIFLDFQNAFDTVNHKILLGKLNCYGIRGIALDWSSSNLRNRSQTVVYNEQESEMKETLCGVQQGSILGPLLFLLDINDLPSVFKLFMSILFADDTNLFCNGPNLNELIEKINEELSLYING